MAATRIEFHAVARALHFPSLASQYDHRALVSETHSLKVLLIQSGMGPAKARKCVESILPDSPWDLILSTGFAGALDTRPIGSVLIGDEVLREPSAISFHSQRITCHPDWVQLVLGFSWKEQGGIESGKFVSMDRVLTKSRDKQTLHASTGANGVDMESGIIGEVAQGFGIPFLIVRAISDGVNDDLPVDFNLFLKPSGWFSGVSRLLLTPKSWKGLFDLYKHSRDASCQLTRFFREFFRAVETMPMLPISVTKKR